MKEKYVPAHIPSIIKTCFYYCCCRTRVISIVPLSCTRIIHPRIYTSVGVKRILVLQQAGLTMEHINPPPAGAYLNRKETFPRPPSSASGGTHFPTNEGQCHSQRTAPYLLYQKPLAFSARFRNDRRVYLRAAVLSFCFLNSRASALTTKKAHGPLLKLKNNAASLGA